MMNWIPSAPAFAGFYPKYQQWTRLHSPFAERLQVCAGFMGDVFSLTGEGWTAGFYRIDANPSVFIKLVEDSKFEKQLAADHVARYVMSMCRIETNTLLPGFPRPFEGQNYSIFVYPYISSRFIHPTEANMAKLGKLIAKTHRCLSQAPFFDKVKSQGVQRFSWIEDALDTFASSQISIPKGAADLLESVPSGFLRVMLENAQPIHGDLNVGNILQDEAGDLILIDFENSLFSWFSPLVDLVFVMERFILIREDIDRQACLFSLLSAFNSLSNIRFKDAQHVINLLQALSIRSLVLLTQATQKGVDVKFAEWQKFIYLYHYSFELEPLLIATFSSLNSKELI